MAAAGQRDEAARRRVLAALSDGLGVAAAARLADCARSTVYSWRRRGDPAIAAALAARRRAPPRVELEPVEAGLRRLALRILAQVAADETARAADRVSAARAPAAQCAPLRLPALPAAVQLPEDDEPVLSADVATSRFRVV